MILYPVESTMLAAAGYDAETETLVALFNTGKAYTYSQVPLEVYLELLSAESKGRYMNEHIRGVYPTELFSGWNKAGKSTSEE
jgi:hypothetical protein